jgi:hypothetical protein
MEGTAVVEAAAVVEEHFDPTVVQVWARSGYMRCDEHSRRIPERVVGGQRLALKDVQARSG